MTRPVVVVGAGLGGLRAAEQLRLRGYDGPLVVVGSEPWRPYNRPPLSKDALLEGDRGSGTAELARQLAFRTRSGASGIEWRLGQTVVEADLAARSLGLADGTAIDYRALVVATGLRPRRLPALDPAGGRHVLRTVDDALALRGRVRPGVRVIVVGGGFIGCETASTLHGLGADVTVVEPFAAPMIRSVGAEAGGALLLHHRAAGVRFVTGQGVASLTGAAGAVDGVVLDDGTHLPADVVVESVGSDPNVEWLTGNGLDLSDGLLCDNDLRVEGRADVMAVGDVARFPNPRFDHTPRRIEHWSIPGETARRAAEVLAASLAGEPGPAAAFAPLPTFWSDQFGLRIHSFGLPQLAEAHHVVEGDLGRPAAGLALECRRAGACVGVVLVNVPAARHPEFRDLVLRQSQPV